MGIILDSSILIAAERGGEGVGQILKRVRAAHGETEAGLSAITIVELTHGIYRAKTDADRKRRQSFTDPDGQRRVKLRTLYCVVTLAERLRAVFLPLCRRSFGALRCCFLGRMSY
jgi:hypothetical protein